VAGMISKLKRLIGATWAHQFCKMVARSRIAWPVLGLLALIGIAGFALLRDIAKDQDEIHAANSIQFMRQAVQTEIDSITNASVEYAQWDDAYTQLTRENDMTWARSNYTSPASSAIFVIRPDQSGQSKVQFSFVASEFETKRVALSRLARAVSVKRFEKSRAQDRDIYNSVFPSGLVNIDGQLASISVQPIMPSPENFAKLYLANGPTDYVMMIAFLRNDFIEETQRKLGLDGLKLTLAPTPNKSFTPTGDDIRFDLKDLNGSDLGRFEWKNANPGSTAFEKRIIPIVSVLLLVGLMTILVTQEIVAKQMRLVEIARKAAEDGNKAKSSFLANVSHELRTPLNAIIGFAEIIDEEAIMAGNQTTAKDARKISNSAQHLLGLINDLLDHAKIEAGKMEISPDVTDLEPLVYGVAEVLQSHVDKNNSQLIVRCDPLIGAAMIDGMRVKQCLLNLVSNAAKFTKNGTITLYARPIEQDGAPFIRFMVKDTGIGMSPATMAKLFTPFVQADEATAKNFGGTGLGLVITRRLCEAMGGSVEVQSVEGQGTTFTMLLPRGMAWVKPVDQSANDGDALAA
jgi:signal transduction histidine kinase/cell division protein ZapA (FtsZ GTPase activity inhibitor)